MPDGVRPGIAARVPGEPVRFDGGYWRDGFLAESVAHLRLRDLLASPVRPADLVAFHARHKLLLLAHSPGGCARLGRMVAQAGPRGAQELAARYAEGFVRTLETAATPGRHMNVLQHIAGYFRDRLDSRSRLELAGTIADYRAGRVPLVVPVTRLAHHARRLDLRYLREQAYLQPDLPEPGPCHHV